jgi:hypothetical protein
MEGTQLNKDDMESKLYMEYTNISIEPGESLESYYHRFTNVVNDLERHKITVPRIAVNSKFVGSLGPDWQKYVTFVRQTKNLHDAPHGLLYDFLKHHEPEVEKDRALRGGYSQPPTPNSLALVAQSHYAPPPMSNHAYVQEQNYFSYLKPTTSNQMVSYDSSLQHTSTQLVPYTNSDAMYYSKSNEDDDEDFNTLNQGLALIARAFSKFSNKTNNHQRSSSNTRNQAVVHDGRVEIQNRNFGRSGSGSSSGILGMLRGLTTMEGLGTIQVLLSKDLKQLQLGTQTLGMQCGVITVMRKVILLQHVQNRELEAVSFTSRHYLWLSKMKRKEISLSKRTTSWQMRTTMMTWKIWKQMQL